MKNKNKNGIEIESENPLRRKSENPCPGCHENRILDSQPDSQPDSRTPLPRIYISFLGNGNYLPMRYMRMDTRDLADFKTPYVQVAELHLYVPFERAYILLTKTSSRKHRRALENDLQSHNIAIPDFIEIAEDLNPDAQLQTLNEILHILEEYNFRCRLVMDMTHGFRAVSIMMSAAVSFLQALGEVEIEHVLYGADQQPVPLPDETQAAPIYDMRKFYQIAELAEGVSRLVELGNAKKLARCARKNTPDALVHFPPEAGPAFDKVSDAFFNVDMHRAQRQIEDAVDQLKSAATGQDATGQPATRQPPNPVSSILAQKVVNHFQPLLQYKISKSYDLNYFFFMYEYIKMLLEHGYFMQAFTVLQETLNSFGVFVIPPEKRKLIPVDPQKFRTHCADRFLLAMRHKKDFFEEKPYDAALKTLVNTLDESCILRRLEEIDRELQKIRNGFNHGWTGDKNGVPADLFATGRRLNECLLEAVKEFFKLGLDQLTY